MQHDFLKQIPRMAKITLPTNFIDWSTNQLNIPSNVHSKNHGNSAGRREWPSLLIDEPHYVIIRSDEAKPRHLGIIFTLNCVFFAHFVSLCTFHPINP